MNTPHHTAGSLPDLPLRGQAPLPGTHRVGCRPRPYPARVRMVPHFEIYDGIMSTRINPKVFWLLFALMTNKRVSSDTAIEYIWPSPMRPPDTWPELLAHYYLRLRAVLKPFGWRIVNEFAWGYSLEKS